MRSMMLLGLIFSFVISSCSKENSGNGVQEQYLQNVSYGTDARQNMDIYLPNSRSAASTNTFIIIHGGAWSEGDKVDFAPYVDTLKRRFPGWAIANLNYRLATGSANFFPTQENDIKAATAFYASRTSEYQVSNNVVFLGASAGAHLAMLQSYKNATGLSVKAVVNFFGPSDMVDLYNNPASPFVPPSAVASVVGATPASNPAIYFQSSPINFITPSSPPTITFQGGLDPLVRPAQQEALKNKLTSNAVANEYILYPGEGHGWIGANLVNSFDRLNAFIKAHVQ